jgi:hypothetical protein
MHCSYIPGRRYAKHYTDQKEYLFHSNPVLHIYLLCVLK